jgi:hypothetical protein
VILLQRALTIRAALMAAAVSSVWPSPWGWVSQCWDWEVGNICTIGAAVFDREEAGDVPVCVLWLEFSEEVAFFIY